MIEDVKKILEEPNISCMDWEIGKTILANWKAELPLRICQLFEQQEVPEVDLRQVVGHGGEVDDSDMTMEESAAAVLASIKDAECQQRVEKVFEGKLTFHVTDIEHLVDVGEWAECQGVGVFVYFPYDTYQQALKEGVK